MPERDRLAVVAWAYGTLRANWRQRGTYRALLALLGFDKTRGADPYRVLMAAGALDLNNALANIEINAIPDRPGDWRPQAQGLPGGKLEGDSTD